MPPGVTYHEIRYRFSHFARLEHNSTTASACQSEFGKVTPHTHLSIQARGTKMLMKNMANKDEERETTIIIKPYIYTATTHKT